MLGLADPLLGCSAESLDWLKNVILNLTTGS